jgi:LmbE family N-acetylglucosaminyl deacetylase
VAPVVALAAAAGAQTPITRDDSYRFAAGRGEEHAITLSRSDGGVRFSWPVLRPGGWDTALIAVRVDATGSAEPWLELRVGGGAIRQYLDPRGRGLRWLNLSGLKQGLQPGVAVDLDGHGARIDAGPALLRTFANRLDLTRPMLVLAAHPDDAEIAAFGLYAGRNATILTVTSGNAGDPNYKDYLKDTAEHYLFKGYLRAVDSVTVPWQGGIPPERCYNLGYFDARLARMREKPEAVVPELYGPNADVSVYRRANLSRLLDNGPRLSSWKNLVDDLAAVLKKVEPEIVVTAHPILDYHPDHQYATVALVEALARTRRSPAFLLYTNHAGEAFYPYGPAGSVVSLPPWPEPEVAVESVYSHPLDARLQLRKLFAIESMHDLRPSPSEQASCPAQGAPPPRPDYPRQPAVDYFRRGPRSEELFLVHGREGLQELVRSFLAQVKP